MDIPVIRRNVIQQCGTLTFPCFFVTIPSQCATADQGGALLSIAAAALPLAANSAPRYRKRHTHLIITILTPNDHPPCALTAA